MTIPPLGETSQMRKADNIYEKEGKIMGEHIVVVEHHTDTTINAHLISRHVTPSK